MARTVLAACALCASCGRIEFDQTEPCPLGPFSTPRSLVEINTAGTDARPVLSPDRLTIWFETDVAGVDRIMRAVRPAVDAPFGAAENVPIPLPGAVADPFISDDGLTLWFSYSDIDPDHFDLYVVTRATTHDDFTDPQPLTVLNSTAADYAPSTTSDGLEMVFNSYRGVDDDLYLSRRMTTTDPWGAPQRIDGVRSDKTECCPSVSADGDLIVFASDVQDPGSTESIFQAARAGDGYANPTPIPETHVFGDGGDTQPSLSRDRKTIVFSSDRSGGQGFFDLYEIDRDCAMAPPP